MDLIVYRNQCVMCEEKGVEAVYFGETARTLAERLAEHKADFSSKPHKSHMRQHVKFFHPELSDPNPADLFRCSVVKAHTSSLYRQIHEVIWIRNFKGITLNSKQEYERCYIPRLNTVDFTQNTPETLPHQKELADS